MQCLLTVTDFVMYLWNVSIHHRKLSLLEGSGRMSTTPTLSKEKVLRIHQQNLKLANYDIAEKQDNLIDVIGGFDNILTILLSSDEFNPTQDQLTKIHSAISFNQLQSIQAKKNDLHIITRSSSNETNESDEYKFVYYFSRKNTFLHSIFGDKYGQKMFDVIHSKFTIIPSFLAGIVGYILLATNINNAAYISGSFINIIPILWSICILFSANKFAFQLIIKSFIFWFKIFYAVQFVVSYIILNFRKSSVDVLLSWIWMYFNVLLLITMFCIIESIQLSMRFKCISGLLLASWFTMMYIWYNFIYLSGASISDYVIYIDSINISISMVSLVSNSAQILAIFVWRQIILSIYNIKKQKCVLIEYSPYFEWTQADNRDQYGLVPLNNMEE